MSFLGIAIARIGVRLSSYARATNALGIAILSEYVKIGGQLLTAHAFPYFRLDGCNVNDCCIEPRTWILGNWVAKWSVFLFVKLPSWPGSSSDELSSGSQVDVHVSPAAWHPVFIMTFFICHIAVYDYCSCMAAPSVSWVLWPQAACGGHRVMTDIYIYIHFEVERMWGLVECKVRRRLGVRFTSPRGRKHHQRYKRQPRMP